MINVFKYYKLGVILLLVFGASGAVLAQKYEFETKTAKKLYLKTEKAYDNYDFGFILDNEKNLLTSFEQKQDTLSALVYSFLGESYYSQTGDLNKSLEYYQKELLLRKKIQPDNNLAVSDLTYSIASLYDELGIYNKSEELYLSLFENDEKAYGKKDSRYIESALGLAIHYVFSAEPTKGLSVLKSIDKNVDKKSEQYPRMLITYGQLNRDLGSLKQALKYYDQAIESYTQLGLNPSFEVVTALNEIHNVQADQGKSPEAEQTLKNALQILEKMEGNNEDIKATFYHNLAEVYRNLGNYEAGIKYIQQSIDILKNLYGDSSPLLAEDLNTLALIYYNDQKYDKAKEIIDQGIEVLEKTVGQDNITFYTFQSNLANIYRESGRKFKGLEIRKKSAEGYKKVLGENNFEYAYELHRLGQAYQSVSDLSNAEKNLLEGQKIRKNTLGKYHPEYAKSLNQLAILKWRQNEIENAIEFFEGTFDNYFKQIDAFFPTLSEEEKAKFYRNKIKLSFEQFNSFAIQNAGKNPDLLSKMYDYQLATKGLIMYATAKVRKTIFESKDETLIEKYTEWVSQKEQLAKLFSSNDSDLEARNAKIDKILESSNEIEKELGKMSEEFAKTYSKANYKWQDVQKKLKDKEAAIEVIRFREFLPDSAGMYTDKIKYAALIITKDTRNNPDMVILENGDKMESRYLANYRNAIRYKVNENYSYNLFWKPIADKIKGIEKVYFSPDGVYNQISIYSLRNPETNNFILDELDIQVVSNTKDLIAYEKPVNTNKEEQKAYLFGFPNYNMGVVDQNNNDPEQIRVAAQKISQAASQGRGMRSASGNNDASIETTSRGLRGNLQKYSSNSLLASLPGTKVEVNNIQNLYKKYNLSPVVYMENEAIEEQLKNIENAKSVHIATHGFFLENQTDKNGEEIDKYVANPLLRSGLILAGANSFLQAGSIFPTGDSNEDGILTAFEAMNMDLSNTEIIVLSACETGLGEVSNGEGVYGLQRSFQVAGASSIIMSMWTVDDKATQELMDAFYEEWFKTGDKRKAFNTAQKRIKETWKSPYYWGAFVMVGI